MVDFAALMNSGEQPKLIEPSELFRSLLTSDKFQYLRDVQQDVLRAWHGRRNARDTVVKMNTGAGKTVVGLLMLQSYLNEGFGPALYLCPNTQLVEQVANDAREFGAAFTSLTGRGELPVEFDNCEKILITTFQKLFNARTVFGVSGGTRQPVSVGALLVDDAHSCLRIARQQVTVVWDQKHPVYKKLLALLESALAQQSEAKTSEIRSGRPTVMAAVPYWAWQAALRDVTRILAEHQDDGELRYAWNLLKECLPTCTCVFTGQKVEISPQLIPVRGVPSLVKADRRIFLSATLADDSILPREFEVDGDSSRGAIRPQSRGDVGERMILVPDLIEPGLGAQLPRLVRKLARTMNIVVLAPSFDAAERWKGVGATIAQGDSIAGTLEGLRTKQNQFVVLVNRYDGVDLPDSACRLLVVDGLPQGDCLYDLYQASVRHDSLLVATRLAQTVEQGFGRGVRSGKDRCVVLVIGQDLVRFIGLRKNLKLFSPETRCQVELGREISQLASKENVPSVEKLSQLVRQCLVGDEGWRKLHAARLAGVIDDPIDEAQLQLGISERVAHNSFYANDFERAVETLRSEVNIRTESQPSDAGWYLQAAAQYVNAVDAGEAQQMQKRAHELNHNLFRPLSGVNYRRIAARRGLQAERVRAWVQEHVEPNAVIVEVSELIRRLAFCVDSDTFESAWKELGAILGFEAQRPEREFGKGPDGLWAMPGNSYLLAEAKSEVLPGRTAIYQSEAEQLSNSVNWFAQEYGDDAAMIALLIHPVSKLADSAYPPKDSRVMDETRMACLHESLSRYAAAIAAKSADAWTVAKIGQLLADYSFTSDKFASAYSVPATR